jgi:gliding motility-associated-like protein
MSLSFNLKPVSCGLKDGSVKALVVGNNPPFNYQWTVNNGIQNTDSIFNLSAGIYSIMVTDSKNCQIIDSVSIQSKSSDLQLSFTSKDVTGCGNKMNGSIDLSVLGSVSTYSVMWSNGAITEDLNGIGPGNYSVVVTTTDNCISSATVSVINTSSSKGGNCLLTIYNGFTPNGDGINDGFMVENIENYSRNQVYIYNRWGAELYHTVEYDNDHNYWDGTYQGKRVPVGTYFYVIMDEKEEVIKKGWIEVTD